MLETILVFVLLPAAIYGLLGLFTLRSRPGRAPRYRPGQEWNHDPVWYSANPDGLKYRPAESEPDDAATLGGARGSW